MPRGYIWRQCGHKVCNYRYANLTTCPMVRQFVPNHGIGVRKLSIAELNRFLTSCQLEISIKVILKRFGSIYDFPNKLLLCRDLQNLWGINKRKILMQCQRHTTFLTLGGALMLASPQHNNHSLPCSAKFAYTTRNVKNITYSSANCKCDPKFGVPQSIL